MTYYSKNAQALSERYNSVNPSILHKDWLKDLPKQPGLACDIGAGSGRDANWLANMGWDVIAVEPSKELREIAKLHSHPNVSWLDDSLPDLGRLRRLGQRFNLILLSAVWMHLPSAKRERAFRILSELLAPGGMIVISLRHGRDEEENKDRDFHAVSVGELEHFAKSRALWVKSVFRSVDALKRQQVDWDVVVLTMPDDGTGSLPLLRHIIVNDDKAATYKLGLLRALIRIADGAPGMVLKQTDTYVEIPFGLVGLYWIRLYKSLILTHKLVQSPRHNLEEKSGLGFAKAEHFYKLINFSSFDLRIGASFEPRKAAIVIGSIRDACSTIESMPANFITYPGQAKQVFESEKRSVRIARNSHWQINKQSLEDFGVFRIPIGLWQSFSQYACWLEPAILTEWARLMDGYNSQYDKSIYDRAFQWEASVRSTTQVRDIAINTSPLTCVWTGRRLTKERFHIDHCFPWSRWFNNDLWNLMPTSSSLNILKSEKLPSAAIMHDSRTRIIDWWETAYIGEGNRRKFFMEAEASLPLLDDRSASFDRVFDAVLYQRTRLRVDQRLVEWAPSVKV